MSYDELLQLAPLLLFIPVITAALVPRRWLVAAMLLWFVSPVFAYFGLALWEMATQPALDYAPGTIMMGFSLLSAILIIPWTLICAAAFAAGFGLRWLRKRFMGTNQVGQSTTDRSAIEAMSTAAEREAAPSAIPTGPRFGTDRKPMFDIEATRRLEALFARPDRDAEWLTAFYDTAWYASVSIPDPAFFDGPDGLPYFRLDLPRVNQPFESQCLANLAGNCVERNAGAAFFLDPDQPNENAHYVLSMGLLDSLLRHDSPDGDPIDHEETQQGSHLTAAASSDQDREILVAAPSRDFLPPATARALSRYMIGIWGIEDPRIGLMVDTALSPSRNLVIGRKKSSFTSDQEIADEMARLLWFLPPNRSLILLPEQWKAEELHRLSDMF